MGYKILSVALLSISLMASDINVKQFINNTNCDQVLNNNGYFETCYDYNLKGARFVAYELDGKLVNEKNLKERPRFYEDKNIPKKYRSKYSDYTRSGYDRGHLANDACFDYSQRSQLSTYVMSNIIPQEPTINRSKKAWAGAERFERVIATKLGKVNVLNGVVYSNNPKRIGHDQIAVPDAYWKAIYNNDKNYQRCFYFENKPVIDKNKKVKDYEVECTQLLKFSK